MVEYKFLPYSLVHKYEKLADYYGISKTARGIEQPKTTDYGFVRVYEKARTPEKLEKIPVKKDSPKGANWRQTRNNRVAAKLGQMKKMKISFYGDDGLPTKMHTILIMWAYSPDEKKIEKIDLKVLDKKK